MSDCGCLPFAPCPPYTVLDSFTRGPISGWGTASNGNSWSLSTATLPSAYVATVDGGMGQVDIAGYAATTCTATLSLNPYTFSTDQDLWIDIGPDVVNSNAHAQDLVTVYLLNSSNGAAANLSMTFIGPGQASHAGETRVEIAYQDGSGNPGGANSVWLGDLQTSDHLTRVRLQIGLRGVRAKVYPRRSVEPGPWQITSDTDFVAALITDLGAGPTDLGVLMRYTPDRTIGSPDVDYFNRADNAHIGDACGDAYPTPNQPIEDEFIAKWDGFTLIFATRYPYNAQSLEIEAAGEGVEVDPTAYATGVFTLLDTSGMSAGDDIYATYLRAEWI